jgi:transcriptional regulator with XRE-family HTH domain
MTQATGETPITDRLRRTISDSGLPLLRLSKETGVARASLIRFVRGDSSLRLDVADKLAEYFGLELSRKKGK